MLTQLDTMQPGDVAILNVSGGDVKISFNNQDPAETIRAARMVKDMLRRGYALLVESEVDGKRQYARATAFDEKTNEYVIADFDPIEAQKEDDAESEAKAAAREESAGDESLPVEGGEAESETAAKGRRGRAKKTVAASGAKTVAVGRSAGG